MRDSALKRGRPAGSAPAHVVVGEELMRDSALKHVQVFPERGVVRGRRRAHARQRFETCAAQGPLPTRPRVGEELMRDSALKLSPGSAGAPNASASRRRAHARQRFETNQG